MSRAAFCLSGGSLKEDPVIMSNKARKNILIFKKLSREVPENKAGSRAAAERRSTASAVRELKTAGFFETYPETVKARKSSNIPAGKIIFRA